ncbi:MULTISPECIES: acyltransferase [Sphingobacterium]|uniref:acyltransferase n=1 Tax=Sphingobacterium TaxID=28453 RepID=UPI00257A29DB|nr:MULTISPECIES: acyltransferase [Sphingobacterium]
MINLTNKIILKIKGDSFRIDKDIPVKYLINLLFLKGISLIWAILVFKSTKLAFLHPTAIIKCRKKIKFGKNLNISRNCYIDALSREGLIFGNNVSIGFETYIVLTGSLKQLGKGIRIGHNVGLGTHGFYGCGLGGLSIGDDTIIGNYVSFHPENHKYNQLDMPIRLQGEIGEGIKIGANCWIGAKATILDGTILGDGSIVAAGAVVRGEFAANSIIGGVPAKLIKLRG